MEWRAAKASRVLRALTSKGWVVKRQRGTYRILGKSVVTKTTFS